jgi:hypothetical protein
MSSGSAHAFQYATPVVSAAFDTGGSATPGTGNNLLAVTGTYDVQAGTIFKIAGSFGDFTPGSNYSFLVATGGTVNPFNFDNVANPSQFDTSAFLGYNSASFLQWHNVGGSVFFNFTPVPEPLHILLMCGGVTVGVRWWRRRTKAAVS